MVTKTAQLDRIASLQWKIYHCSAVPAFDAEIFSLTWTASKDVLSRVFSIVWVAPSDGLIKSLPLSIFKTFSESKLIKINCYQNIAVIWFKKSMFLKEILFAVLTVIPIHKFAILSVPNLETDEKLCQLDKSQNKKIFCFEAKFIILQFEVAACTDLLSIGSYRGCSVLVNTTSILSMSYRLLVPSPWIKRRRKHGGYFVPVWRCQQISNFYFYFWWDIYIGTSLYSEKVLNEPRWTTSCL